MPNFSFQLTSLFYNILITIIYFSKKKVNSIENRIYSVILIINVMGLFVDVTSVYLGVFYPKLLITNVVAKLYLLNLLAWLYAFSYYLFVISFKNTRIFKINSHFLCIIILVITYIFNSILIFAQKLNMFSENHIMYTFGDSASTTYLFAGLNIFFWLVCLVLNYKSIKNKKYLPAFLFILIGGSAAEIQGLYPPLLIVNSSTAFITVLTFFTIENPDVKLINELNISKEQAVKANEAKTDFLSNMSHEIRTPLNAIVGFSQSLSEQNINEEVKEDVSHIIIATENLLEIVNGILDISKIEANKLEIINNEYSFNKLMNEVVSLARGRLGEKQLDFRYEFDKSIPDFLYGDHLRVKQIIINLLTNAIKYTKEGFVEFRISSVIKNDICRLIISVEDSGVGIKKDKIDKLFTKFERMDMENNTSIEGTGLGLAITKRLIELMHGQIVVQSEYGEGSKFTVALDQKIVNNPKTEVQNTMDIDIKDIHCSNKKILVVDDNKINLKVASKLLKCYDIIVDELSSGQECIDKIMSGAQYDLILLDDMMPKLSGSETIKILKSIYNFNIPVVVLTANAISGMKEKYMSIGFDDYLSKPIDRHELNKIIKKYLDND